MPKKSSKKILKQTFWKGPKFQYTFPVVKKNGWYYMNVYIHIKNNKIDLVDAMSLYDLEKLKKGII